MNKSLSFRIAERAAQKKSTLYAKHRACFLALRDEIKLALQDGWPVKTIWETLHAEKKIAFSYQAFRGYVNRLIFRKEESKDILEETILPNHKEISQPKIISKPIVTQFRFDPTPNKEDLF